MDEVLKKKLHSVPGVKTVFLSSYVILRSFEFAFQTWDETKTGSFCTTTETYLWDILGLRSILGLGRKHAQKANPDQNGKACADAARKEQLSLI